MILRAQPIGHPPSRRWVILNVKENTVWDGEKFIEDWVRGMKFAHPSDACNDMAQVLKSHYNKLEKRTFVVPIEVEVYGSATPGKIARYLHSASVLNIRTQDYGNGPNECLVLPIIHWGKIREINESVMAPSNDDIDSDWEESDEDQ